jgi:hypothetical protein
MYLNIDVYIDMYLNIDDDDDDEDNEGGFECYIITYVSNINVYVF